MKPKSESSVRRIHQQIRRYIIDRIGIPLDATANPVEWLIASHFAIGQVNKELREEVEELKRKIYCLHDWRSLSDDLTYHAYHTCKIEKHEEHNTHICECEATQTRPIHE